MLGVAIGIGVWCEVQLGEGVTSLSSLKKHRQNTLTTLTITFVMLGIRNTV